MFCERINARLESLNVVRSDAPDRSFLRAWSGNICSRSEQSVLDRKQYCFKLPLFGSLSRNAKRRICFVQGAQRREQRRRFWKAFPAKYGTCSFVSGSCIKSRHSCHCEVQIYTNIRIEI